MRGPVTPLIETGFVRRENQSAVTAAMEWGLERCRGDASRALFSALIILLGNLNATVLPVEQADEATDVVDFRVTFSRPDGEGHAKRIRFAITEGTAAPTEQKEESGSVESRLQHLSVDAQSCRERPWQTAGALVGTMLEMMAAKH